MAKRPSNSCVNLEDSCLLCVNISIEEFEQLQGQICSLIHHQKYFKDSSECQEYLDQHTSKHDRIVLIISDTSLCKEFLTTIDPLVQIWSIYIRCQESNTEESADKWSDKSSKIQGVFNDTNSLATKIQYDQTRREQNRCIDVSFAFTAFNIVEGNREDQSSSDINAEFLHSLLVLDVLLRMQRTVDDPNNELINLCRDAYRNNPSQLRYINELAMEYTPSRALWWYTRNCFLYKILNKAFRVDNTNLLYLFRSFIYDLQNQLKECQCTSTINVYRGQLMSSNELKHLQSSINHFISMKSFLSTTLNRSLASFYLGESETFNVHIKRVLFEIEADPRIEGIKPFGKIAPFSAIPNENEILFMARSIFQIVAVEDEGPEKITIVRMKLCGDQQNHLKDIYEQNRKNYGGGRQKQTTPITLGNVLQRMGHYDEAELFYHRQLNEALVKNDDPRIISWCYFNMGEILREKNDYFSSRLWYQKALETDMTILPANHPNIGNTHNSLGIVYEHLADYEAALDSYCIALKIALEAFGWNNTRVALCLNNIGNTYQYLDDYVEALNCHFIALTIREKNLPANHHRLAASHHNIAVVYHRAGYFDIAYERYKKALQMCEKSLPSDHPDIARIRRNLSILMESRGDLKQALIEYERELKRLRQILTSNHSTLVQLDSDIDRVRSKLLSF